ncbi:TBC1 domain family member 15-like isoform X2 [Actinia tenebrosa]|uniref:TBC1 domain family member 15-like isoform X2 n=1 Tax=Actinia tenebrosa TaxID=6105 RepID=A0A6P8I6J9_ACTTE|nr:TBC1 domain family member 15-like isoform X2 [Actinia tenebrosa]
MAAASQAKTETKEKVVYSQDGVFVHTAVPTTTHSANIIPGRVSLIEKDNSTFVDWSPCDFGDDDYELQSSDYSEWNLVTQNKQKDEKNSPKKKEKSKYAIHFDIKKLHSIRRSDPRLAWSYIVFILKDSNTLPALHFHSGGIMNLIRNLQRYIWITRSATNHKLFLVDDEQKALRMSLTQLQLFPEGAPQTSYISHFFNAAYYDGMDALSKVTKYFRDTMDVMQSGPNLAEMDDPLVISTTSPRKDAEFEDLGEATSLSERNIPHRRCLGEVPMVSREEPLREEGWKSMLDSNGRVINIKKLHDKVFKGGIDKGLRREVWKYLLGYYKYGCTFQSRFALNKAKEEEYRTMKTQWQTISAKQEKHFSEYRERKQLVEKDVMRTDRTHPYYIEEPNNKNITTLNNVLMTYCMYNFDLGYVQGMSDLLSPVLFIMDNEVDAFWCFVGLMKKVAHNFDENQEGMKMQLHQLAVLLKFVDPLFYSYLEQHDSGNLYFCFRWLIINFKREFQYDDIMTLWEAMWTQNLSPNFHLIICLAILDKHRQLIMEMNFGFNEILKLSRFQSSVHQ